MGRWGLNSYDKCIANGVKVINLSLTISGDSYALHKAIINACNNGITVVCAAGNEGGPVKFPARYSEVIAVSACDINNKIAWWSNRGPEIDLIAPGVIIYSTLPNFRYAYYSGTSMASPHVAGAAAVLLQAFPTLTPDQVRQKLMSTAQKLSLTSDQQGGGLVNVANAIKQ